MRKFVLALSASAAFLLAVMPAFAAGPADKAVLAALDAYGQAMVKQDKAALEKIFTPNLSYAHSSAQLETKAQAIPHIVDGAGWKAMEFSETTVRVQGNVALVNGKTDMHQRSKGSDKITISKLLVLSVWVKGAPGWQMIARQAVRRPDDDQVIAAKAALAASAPKAPPAAPAK